ncbi:MAG TPA: ATP-binding protein [Gemmatimonadaceae bacterium]|nr:ATP-binding protein [Gemmatimonadaceae bacterium]
MTLARRLLLGALVVVLILVASIVVLAGGRLRERLIQDKTDELARDAQLVASSWTRGVDPDSLAHHAGQALGYRVTIIDSTGVVVGDAEFDPEARHRLQNHSTRPEVMAARDSGRGWSLRHSVSAGDDELYVAVRHPLGFVRVSLTISRLEAVVSGARRDVLTSGLVVLLGVLLIAWLFARTVSRPIVELRDVARAIAAGDLSRRPALSAPGEVGDLATALHRMAEQLSSRLAAMQADELLMTAVLESLEEGVLALDERGMVVRINQRARTLLDLGAALPFPRELLPREHELRVAVEAALGGDATPPTETRLYDRTLVVASRPLARRGAVVTVLDLTQLRRLETVRRDFVANVSHELKTPLTAVRGFAETLLDEEIPADQRRAFAQTIRDNAERMQRIVDDLLDLSRIESGGWQPKTRRVDIAAVVREVFAGAQELASRRGVQLVADVPPGAASVHADPTAFRQVLGNLVENAVRYTTTGSVTVRSRLGAGGVWIDVRDTGIGIAAEHLPRIFERFYRVDAGRSREQGGTGLGLAIVRHLVDAHGGRVEAASVPGRGTTISVLFPSADGAPNSEIA